MGQADFYKHGDWNFICDVCGFKFKASEGMKRWDGVYVCRKDFEMRHPQERRRGIKDPQAVEWTRPESPDVFITDADPYVELDYSAANPPYYVDIGYVYP